MARTTVSAPIAPQDLDALRRLAEAEDRSVSSLIRRAIQTYISSEAAGQGSSTETTSRSVLDARPA
jgi:predicted transcriptional regulator